MSKLARVGVSFLTIALFGACGSNSDGDGAGGNGGINLGFGGNTGVGNTGNTGNTGNGTLDGGEVPITSDQVKSIKNQACAADSIEGEALPSVLELVVDTSSSMSQTAPGSRQSKWEVTRDALLEAVVGVDGPGLAASIGVGLIFYPNKQATINRQPGNTTDCVNTAAAIAPALLGGATAQQRTLVRNAIEQVQLERSTPTHDAYKYAFENAISKTNLSGRRFMVLVTDGAPTLSLGCMNQSGNLNEVDPDPIVEEIQRSADAGIKTFLIGSPGSESNRSWMSHAAVIGGTAPAGCKVDGPNYCHMDMTTEPDFSAALRNGLAQIAGQVNTCTYAFATPPSGQIISADNINVILTSSDGSTLVVRDDVGDCKKGWQLTSNQQILLCPDTCASVQSDPNISVDVLFGCQSLGEPPK